VQFKNKELHLIIVRYMIHIKTHTQNLKQTNEIPN